MSETITGKLAAFVEDCEIDTLPQDVKQRAQMFILDYLGVSLTGTMMKSSEIVSDVVQRLGGHQTCTVIGRSYMTNAPLAALVNGTTGHAIEMDDDHRTSVSHPGTAVIPAALATAELVKAHGRTMLEGVVAGYEVMTRIGDAFLGKQYYEGFHPTGTCGVFGAAAAASKILGLTKQQTVTALGIAGTQAAGLEEWKTDGSWIKRLHPGKAAEAGVLAALLAKDGYTGPETILEGPHGFLKAFSFEHKWNEEGITAGLGSEYRGYETSFKPYAGCRFFHQVVDACMAVTAEHGIKPDDVEEVLVRIYKTAYDTLFEPAARRYRPETMVDAQFSIPYAVAISILYGAPLPIHFSEELLNDKRVLDLVARVKGVPDLEFESGFPERFPTEVTFLLTDGTSISEFRDLPTGDPENEIYKEAGLFENQMEAKFRNLLSLLPEFDPSCDRMVTAVHNLEHLSNVSDDLLKLFRRSA